MRFTYTAASARKMRDFEMRMSANRKPNPANETPNRISRDSHDESQCRITLNVLVMSFMCSIETASPNTIAGPIAYSTGCTVEDAQEFIDTEKALFPGVEEWYDFTVTPAVRKNTQSHQEQTAEGAWITYLTGTYKAKSGTCYEFREYPKVIFADGRRCTVMDFKPTQIRNYPIQGESAFFVQTVAGQIIRWLIGKTFFGGKCFVINQVHDAVYLDVHKDVLDEVARSVKYIMELLPETMKSYGYDLGLPFPAEVEYGPNMLEKHKWKEAA